MNDSSSNVLKVVEESKIQYPLIVKTNQARGLSEAHFIYTAIDDQSLINALNDDALKGKEIVIEKLVPHNENFLVKAYVIGS